ncbi:serine/threonine-protein kinase [Streptomyces sp. NPDC050448]|uniref:serine/threonine-protein kinase n=1 Tax=Streptomyces sp. NPDC050448 TaxID=3155404 RepID=UPI0034132BEE
MKPLAAADPEVAGPYRLLAELGRGGMGRVLLGASPDGRLVVVKQIHAHLATDDDFRIRFRREVAASRKVSGAYTAAVMDADADAETPWLASVFVTGPSLGAAVQEVGPLPEGAVRRLAAGLATALMEIHRVGLVHRDLKPDNVLLAEDGIRVIDFGISRVVEGEGATELTRTGWVVGSPSFMSPEQAESRELTPAGDVFSLGSVLVLAATGCSPFAGNSTFQTLYNVVHAEPQLAAVPAGLRPLIERCLAKRPEGRPTPAQLLELIGPVAPAGRPWPPAVYRMIEARRGDVGRLVDGPQAEMEPVPEVVPEPAIAAVPASPVPASPVLASAVPASPVPASAVPASAVPASAAPRPRRRAVPLAAFALVLVAALGGGAYTLWGDGNGNYKKLGTCEELTSKMPAGRNVLQDGHAEGSSGARTTCEWPTVGSSGRYAMVQWDLAPDAEAAKTEYPEPYAYEKNQPYDCIVKMRDRNLGVTVHLGTPQDGSSDCEGDGKSLAQAALGK